jgi:hypothetical protein
VYSWFRNSNKAKSHHEVLQSGTILDSSKPACRGRLGAGGRRRQSPPRNSNYATRSLGLTIALDGGFERRDGGRWNRTNRIVSIEISGSREIAVSVARYSLEKRQWNLQYGTSTAQLCVRCFVHFPFLQLCILRCLLPLVSYRSWRFPK